MYPAASTQNVDRMPPNPDITRTRRTILLALLAVFLVWIFLFRSSAPTEEEFEQHYTQSHSRNYARHIASGFNTLLTRVPTRLVVTTLNTWHETLWDVRAASVAAFLGSTNPDLLCVQRTTDSSLAFLQEALPHHAYVNERTDIWRDANIFWRTEFFEVTEHGGDPDVSLLWVFLRFHPKETSGGADTSTATGKSLLVVNINPPERSKGQFDEEQLNRIVKTLQRLQIKADVTFVAGGLGSVLAHRLSQPPTEVVHAFQDLGIPVPPTFPARPLKDDDNGTVDEARDFVLASQTARALSAHVAHVRTNGIPPSIHWPVVAVYELV